MIETPLIERSLLNEQSLLGSFVIDPSSIDRVEGMVSREEFLSTANRDLFDLILAMHRARQPVDPVAVFNEGTAKGLDLTREYMFQLMEQTPTSANAEEYAKAIREAARLRALEHLADNVKDAAQAGWSSDKIIKSISRAVEAADRSEEKNGVYTEQEAMIAFWNHLGARMSGKKLIVSTGYPGLDKILGGGLLNSGLYILAARPGMGKTTLALNIADKVAASGPVLFVTLEMDVEQLQAKRLARVAMMPSSRILMDNSFTQDEMAALELAGGEIERLPLLISKAPSLTVDGISSLARRVKGVRMIVIDYFGKIEAAGKGSRYEEMTAISGKLKTLAREYKVPVLVLAQLNRANEGRSDKRPQLADLRDTGAAEQDADGVIFLYREDYYDGGDDEISPLEVIVAKNRHGSVGTCRMAFNKALCKMSTHGWDITQSKKGQRAEKKRKTFDELHPDSPLPEEFEEKKTEEVDEQLSL